MRYPPILYKYRAFNDYSLRLLSENEVFFSAPNRLNDPRDCRLPLLYEKGTLKQIYNKNLENLKYVDHHLTRKERKKEAERMAKIVYANRDDPVRKEEFRKSIADNTNKTVGILSLSAVNNNPLMWSHYSDSQSGFCVGFDTQKLLQFIDKVAWQEIFVLFDNVAYYNELPQINPYKMNDEEVFRAMVFSKSSHWAHEEEYRLMCADRPDFALALDSNIISRVLLGPNCSQENEQKVIEILKSRGDNVLLFKAVHRDIEYEIAFDQVKYP
jgi:hypothetical protein